MRSSFTFCSVVPIIWCSVSYFFLFAFLRCSRGHVVWKRISLEEKKKTIWFGFRVADIVPPIVLRAPNNSRCITQCISTILVLITITCVHYKAMQHLMRHFTTSDFTERTAEKKNTDFWTRLSVVPYLHRSRNTNWTHVVLTTSFIYPENISWMDCLCTSEWCADAPSPSTSTCNLYSRYCSRNTAASEG